MRALAFALLAALCGAAGSPVHAQTVPQLELPKQPKDGRVKPGLPDSAETFGERLDESNGVIRPPDEGIAPDMRVPPKDPSAGANMPVIPPSKIPDGVNEASPN